MVLEPLQILPEVPDQQLNPEMGVQSLAGWHTVSLGGWRRVDHHLCEVTWECLSTSVWGWIATCRLWKWSDKPCEK